MSRLVTDRRIPVTLDETSDVVALPSGAFLVVSDTEHRAAIVGEGVATTYLDLPGLPRGEAALEAVAYDELAQRLISYAEESGELLVHSWNGRAGSPATLTDRRTLRLGKKKNKGVEGVATFPGGLVLANEDKPRGLFLLRAGDDAPIALALDPAIAEALDDFSGLAFDAQRGTFLLVSDESASLVELAIEGSGTNLTAHARGAHTLVDERGDALERVEGVAVDGDGAWWVLLENERVLCRVRARGV